MLIYDQMIHDPFVGMGPLSSPYFPFLGLATHTSPLLVGSAASVGYSGGSVASSGHGSAGGSSHGASSHGGSRGGSSGGTSGSSSHSHK